MEELKVQQNLNHISALAVKSGFNIETSSKLNLSYYSIRSNGYMWWCEINLDNSIPEMLQDCITILYKDLNPKNATKWYENAGIGEYGAPLNMSELVLEFEAIRYCFADFIKNVINWSITRYCY